MTKATIFLLLLFSLIGSSFTQICQSGALYVSGNNCGCGSDCDLSPYGGPNCGSGTLGNCDGGYLYMSTRVGIPTGCEVEVNVFMKNQPGCNFSGADGGNMGCTTGDRLRVRSIDDNAKAYVCGSGNQNISDFERLFGPDTILIEGFANRQDEILQYSISYLSGNCDASCSALPATFDFVRAQEFHRSTLVEWQTLTEVNTSHFILSRSNDGTHFNFAAKVDASTNASHNRYYSTIIEHYINYIKLELYDRNGLCTSSKIISVSHTDYEENDLLNLEFSAGWMSLHFANENPVKLSVYASTGEHIQSVTNWDNIDYNYRRTRLELASGVYFLCFRLDGKSVYRKLFVQ